MSTFSRFGFGSASMVAALDYMTKTMSAESGVAVAFYAAGSLVWCFWAVYAVLGERA